MSRSLALALLDELDDQALDLLAEKLAPRLVRPPQGDRSPWFTVDEAVEYLRCKSRQRIYDLKSSGRLPAAGSDGSRPLFHRDDLDAWIAAHPTSREAPR
jgi:excisionase family DNA binding protein